MTSFIRLLTFALFASAASPLFAVDADLEKHRRDLVSGYVPIAKALAADDHKAAQAAATALAKKAESNKLSGIAAQAKAIADGADIAASRAALRPLTAVVEPLAAGEKDVTVMYCPMARGTWVQANGPVENPYYGKMMLACGGPKAAKK